MSEKEVETIRNIDILLTEAGVSEDSLPAVLTLFNTVMDIKERSFAEMLKSLQETIKTLNTTIAELTEKVSRLEAKNNRNCSNSNKPSSWDHFSKPKPRPSSTYAGDKKKLKSGGWDCSSREISFLCELTGSVWSECECHCHRSVF